MQLTLFEREVSKESLHARLRTSIGALLNHVRGVFDIVLIDCPPGLSVLTESWLREADFHFSPTKPDYVSTCGLEVFRRFKGLNPEMGFAENLGVIINMKDAQSAGGRPTTSAGSPSNPDNRCFTQTVPRTSALQHAAQLSPVERSYVGQVSGRVRRRHPRRVPGAAGPRSPPPTPDCRRSARAAGKSAPIASASFVSSVRVPGPPCRRPVSRAGSAMPSTVFDSDIFRDAFGSPAMRAIFSDEATIARYVEVEVALAAAEASVGVIPKEAAAAIKRLARAEAIDVAKLKAETDLVGYPIVGVVHQLAKQCGEAGRYVHWGATTQDIMDTATVLQIRDALALVEADLAGARRGARRAGQASIATR